MSEEEYTERERYVAAIMLLSEERGITIDEAHQDVSTLLDAIEIIETSEGGTVH